MQKYASRATGELREVSSRGASARGASGEVCASDVSARIGGAVMAATAFAIAALIAPSAAAHIQLLDPPPRYVLQDGSDNGIKSCPCGLGGSNRICNVAQDGSDPDRSERVSRFEAGSTITLRFEEFINHAGRFRVAFDPDGADMADFNANILEDVPDPANANGMMWEIPITLPNMTCDNCTLQLVQAMEVDQSTPIADPASISSYYACVDIQLVAPGTLGDNPAEPPGDGQPDPNTPGDPGANPGDPGANPGDPGMMGGDPAGDDTDPNGGTPGGDATGDNAGSQNAGMNGTPLIPAGSGTPTDSTSTGAPSADPTGAVPMNGATAAPPGTSGIGAAQPLPNLGGPSAGSSSSGGCSVTARDSRHGGDVALGLGAFGLLALFSLRRARTASRRASHPGATVGAARASSPRRERPASTLPE